MRPQNQSSETASWTGTSSGGSPVSFRRKSGSRLVIVPLALAQDLLGRPAQELLRLALSGSLLDARLHRAEEHRHGLQDLAPVPNQVAGELGHTRPQELDLKAEVRVRRHPIEAGGSLRLHAFPIWVIGGSAAIAIRQLRSPFDRCCEDMSLYLDPRTKFLESKSPVSSSFCYCAVSRPRPRDHVAIDAISTKRHRL